MKWYSIRQSNLVRPFVLLQTFNKVNIVKLNALVREGLAKHLELLVTERDFVVVKDRTHPGEGNTTYLSHILVLEEGLQQNSMLTNHLSKSE